MRRMRSATGAALRTAAAFAVFAAAFHAAPASAQQPGQRVFATSGAAAHALVMALQKGDTPTLRAIFGDQATRLALRDGVGDRRDRERFVEEYKEMHRLVKEPDGRVILYMGADNWPFPVPLMSSRKGWYFDSDAGLEEIACRNIGANEMNAMKDAKAYARNKMTLAANSKTLRDGYYFFAVPGGAKNSGAVVIAAYPAEYRVTGVKTFLVSAESAVHEKDLGVNTAKRVKAMTRYRVDATWLAVR